MHQDTKLARLIAVCKRTLTGKILPDMVKQCNGETGVNKTILTLEREFKPCLTGRKYHRVVGSTTL